MSYLVMHDTILSSVSVMVDLVETDKTTLRLGDFGIKQCTRMCTLFWYK